MGKEPTRSHPSCKASHGIFGRATLFAIPIFEQTSLAPVGTLPPTRPSDLLHTGTVSLHLILVHLTAIRLVALPDGRTLGKMA